MALLCSNLGRCAILGVMGLFAVAARAETPLQGAESPSADTRVLVRLVAAPGVPLEGDGFVVFQGSAREKPVVVPTKLPAAAEARLPGGSHWSLLADFPGYFAPVSAFQVPRENLTSRVEVQVTLRPAGTLTGKFAVDSKEKLPEGLEARFEPTRATPPIKQDVPAGSAPCAIGPDGSWRCRLPAGRLDLALHPKGFVPLYLWNVGVAPGETSALGQQKIVRGASVAGWVVREDGAPSEACKVRLESPTTPGGSHDRALAFLRSVASEAPCEKNGFFQFSAVAAGSYTLAAEEKEARAHLSPLEVWDGAESRLTMPLMLRRPADFEVTLSPAADWLGRPWRFEARRANDYRAGWEEPSFRVEAGEDGRIRIPKQFAGRFWIKIYDQLGNSLFSDPYVDLSDPARPYAITLDLLRVDGTVRLGDEPVEGRLFFGPGPSGGTRIEMTSDEEGRFAGPLPQPGDWRVEIQSAEPELKALAKVNVNPKGGRASVEIELPDTKVFGRVVDPSGAPAPGATVTLTTMIGALFTTANENGEFEMRAFAEGSTAIDADRPAGYNVNEVSDIHYFNAAKDSSHGPVVLELQRSRKVRGRVLAPTGPVIGATVYAAPPAGGDGVLRQARSGIDGSFELSVPEQARALDFIVNPPGGALKAYEVSLPDEGELLFQAEPQGGDLIIDVGDSDALAEGALFVWQGGDVVVPVNVLHSWTEGHGVRMYQGSKVHLARLAPGPYTVCLGARGTIQPERDTESWKKQAKCSSGYLSAGSELALALP